MDSSSACFKEIYQCKPALAHSATEKEQTDSECGQVPQHAKHFQQKVNVCSVNDEDATICNLFFSDANCTQQANNNTKNQQLSKLGAPMQSQHQTLVSLKLAQVGRVK